MTSEFEMEITFEALEAAYQNCAEGMTGNAQIDFRLAHTLLRNVGEALLVVDHGAPHTQREVDLARLMLKSIEHLVGSFDWSAPMGGVTSPEQRQTLLAEGFRVAKAIIATSGGGGG